MVPSRLDGEGKEGEAAGGWGEEGMAGIQLGKLVGITASGRSRPGSSRHSVRPQSAVFWAWRVLDLGLGSFSQHSPRCVDEQFRWNGRMEFLPALQRPSGVPETLRELFCARRTSSSRGGSSISPLERSFGPGNPRHKPRIWIEEVWVLKRNGRKWEPWSGAGNCGNGRND